MATTALRPRVQRPARAAPRARADLVLLGGLAGIGLLAAALRFPALGAHLPQLIGPDEPTVALRALAVLDGDLVPPQWDWPPLSSYLLAGGLALARPFVAGVTEDPARLYGFGRVLYAMVSVLTVLATGALGAAVAQGRGDRRVVAWGAAAATAVAFLLVRLGRLVHPEQLQPLLMIAALLCVLRLDRAQRRVPLIVGAGLLAGMAGATKYLGVIVVLPLAAAIVWTGRRRARELGLAAAATATGFVVGTLGTVFRVGHFLEGVAGQFTHQATGHLGYEPVGPGWLFHLGQSLPGTWGWPVTLLGVAGVVWGLAAGDLRLRLVALTAAPMAVLVTVGQVRFPHYIVIALPFLAVLAAALLARLAKLARARVGGLAAACLIAAVGLSLVPTLANDIRLVRANAAASTREVAATRIAAMAPAVPVRSEAYALTGDATTFAFGRDPTVADCGCWVAISSVQEERFRRRPDLYPSEVAVYDALRARGRVLDVVAPDLPSSYRWDQLPQWGVGDLPLTGAIGLVGPTVTVLDLSGAPPRR